MPQDMPQALATRGLYLHRASDLPPTQYQVLGERGCGTNLVRKLIQRTWAIERIDSLCWKHGFPTMLAIPPRLLIVCVQRNAFDWATSLYKRPWHASHALQELDFSAFLRAEWDTRADRLTDFDAPEGLALKNQPLQHDRHPITGAPFANIFALRNAKAAALLGLRNRACDVAYVQLEAVQKDPETFIHAFGAALDLQGTPKGYSPVTRRLGNRFPAKVKDRPAPPADWSPQDRAFALSALDREVEAAWGYAYAD